LQEEPESQETHLVNDILETKQTTQVDPPEILELIVKTQDKETPVITTLEVTIKIILEETQTLLLPEEALL